MAGRGVDTLRFGPMKPVGLTDPRTGREAYAVVQLRQDTLAGDHFSLVGFQTQMKWGEQARVFKLIPGLENAEFVRFGMIHRNTYINGPTILRETWQVKDRDDLFFAGQISGVEGYVESAASGLMAGRNAAAFVQRPRDERAAEDDGARSTCVLRVARGSAALSADEHHVRHHAADRRRHPAPRQSRGWPPFEPKGSAQVGAFVSRAGGVWTAGCVARSSEPLQARAEARAPHRSSQSPMQDEIEAFLEHLRLNENASLHTVRAYESRSRAVRGIPGGIVGPPPVGPRPG